MTKKTRISFHLELMKPGVPATWSAQPSVHLNIMSHAGVRPVNNPIVETVIVQNVPL